jgi:hypothetical protein
MLPGDETNHDILVTNKSEENYECTTVSGMQSSCNVIIFKNDSETGEVNKDQTAYFEMDTAAAITVEGNTSR